MQTFNDVVKMNEKEAYALSDSPHAEEVKTRVSIIRHRHGRGRIFRTTETYPGCKPPREARPSRRPYFIRIRETRLCRGIYSRTRSRLYHLIF